MRCALLAVLVLLAAAGCAGDDGPARPTVLAAASLTEAFGDLGGARFSFAGSQALVRQLRDGAPADVIATADRASMQVLVDAGLVRRPQVFARNRLAIAVAPGDPKGVRSLRDLARPDVAVVLADPSVPVGVYARRAIDRAGVDVQPRSLELDARAALAKVTTGEADAAVVYATDVRAAGARAEVVTIPAPDNVTAEYPVAAVKGGDARAARAFLARLLGPAGRRALAGRGFLAPP